ncbi:MAG TPA: FAD:protein FMN transferase [Thermoanaerobaculia bacterium]|nr:FAD:protein FMN transferase [Thermoanaerobaculia bacterium]
MFLLLVAFLLGAPTGPAAQPVRSTAPAFGATAEVEVRGLPEEPARRAVARALAEVAEIERLTSSEGPAGGLTSLNTAAGRGHQAVDPRLMTVLTRALDFCVWSEVAHGPLGRGLYQAWGLRSPAPEPPDPERIESAVALAACERLHLDPAKGTAAVDEGSGLDLWGFAEGFAVDRAVEVLREQGVVNGLVRLGSTWRGFGEGPAGKGWPVTLPAVPGLGGAAGRIFLRDSSLSIVLPAERPSLNHRTGKPVQGVVATAAATPSALDAQALAAVLTVTGPREGQLRLGSLQPRPSVIWFMGTGEGHPLQVEYRWSQVPKK